MPNVFLSGRIPPELNRKLEEVAASMGHSKTRVVINALRAYLGIESPVKVSGDRIQRLELEMAGVKGAVKSLHEKLDAFMRKAEDPKVDIEPMAVSSDVDAFADIPSIDLIEGGSWPDTDTESLESSSVDEIGF